MLLNIFKRELICLLCFCATGTAQAQFAEHEKYLELGLLACATNYSGDLADDHISFAQTKLAAGAFARLHLSPVFQIRGQVFVGRIGGDDKNFPDLAGRHFQFNTTLVEGAALLEATIAAFEYQPVSSDASYFFFPYIFGGVGGVAVQAETTYYGPESERDCFVVEPLPEGGTSKRTLLTTPFGLGLRVVAGSRFSIGVEACARPVYNDLLDGVSKNGNPSRNDWYHSIGFTFSYFLGKPWQSLN